MNAPNSIARSKIFQTVFKIAFSAMLLFYILSKADVGAIGRILSSIKINYYLAALCVFFIAQPVKTIRWSIFLKVKSVSIPQKKLLLLYFIGLFFNNFLPTVVGGDMVRTWYIYKEYHTREIPALSVAIERLCGLFSLFVIGLLSGCYWFFLFGASPLVTTCLTTCIIIIASMLLLVSPSFHTTLTQLLKKMNLIRGLRGIGSIYRSFQGYTRERKALCTGFILSLVASGASIFVSYCLSLSLAWDIPFTLFLFVMPIITILTMIPVTFGGIGLRESAFFLVFSQVGVTGPSAVSLALLWYSINLISGAVGGVCYALYRTKPSGKIQY